VDRLQQIYFFIAGIVCLAMAGCSSPKKLVKEGFAPSSVDVYEIVHSIPDYQDKLQSIKGKGRAIVSEPGNTERVTVLFSSNRMKSLVTVRNGIGIEGGQMLSDGDTLLVYNKIDKFARKIPIRGGKLDRINRLASLNILDMISYSVSSSDVETVWENEELYQLQLSSGTNVFVDKNSGVIRQVEQPADSELPYSKIKYDAYSSIKGFTLPRRISIFGAEGESKVALQLTGLELNPALGALTINLPDDTRIYYR
jgi:outer membrane lipoprotein-sorting protein